MPIYALKTSAAWIADATLNGATFSDVASPGDITGLTNGTAYQARQVLLSGLSAEFTPVVPAAFSATYAGGDTSGTPAGDPTSLTLPIGDAHADRWVVFTVHAFLRLNTPDKLAGITINGNPTTILARRGGTDSINQIVLIGITQAKVPTGTTATINIDWVDGFQPNNGVAVRAEAYRLIASSAPTLADSDSKSNASMELDVAVGDVMIAALTSAGSSATDPAVNWSGATHRSTVNLNGTGLYSSTADDLNVAAAATGRVVSNTNVSVLAGVVLRETA